MEKPLLCDTEQREEPNPPDAERLLIVPVDSHHMDILTDIVFEKAGSWNNAYLY